jgi:hypothetical protein
LKAFWYQQLFCLISDYEKGGILKVEDFERKAREGKCQEGKPWGIPANSSDQKSLKAKHLFSLKSLSQGTGFLLGFLICAGEQL